MSGLHKFVIFFSCIGLNLVCVCADFVFFFSSLNCCFDYWSCRAIQFKMCICDRVQLQFSLLSPLQFGFVCRIFSGGTDECPLVYAALHLCVHGIYSSMGSICFFFYLWFKLINCCNKKEEVVRTKWQFNEPHLVAFGGCLAKAIAATTHKK